VNKEKLDQDNIVALFNAYKLEINQLLPNYMNISQIEIQSEEFVKTPKRSIKRFMYS
jgi:long-chain acyl-CoA synthetase